MPGTPSQDLADVSPLGADLAAQVDATEAMATLTADVVY